MPFHDPLFVRNLSLSFPHKICFEDFNGSIYAGDRIALVGKNGAGKSSFLKIFLGQMDPTAGHIMMPSPFIIGYVPQLVEISDSNNTLSGGEKFHRDLSQALSLHPHLLILDEPTNHLDRDSKRDFLRFLQKYRGTMILASHDREILNHCINKIWHLHDGTIHVFSGNYEDYLRSIQEKREEVFRKTHQLKLEEKQIHQSIMREQTRAAHSRTHGQKNIDRRKWPTVLSKAKIDRAIKTTGEKKSLLSEKKKSLNQHLSILRLPEVLVPRFFIRPGIEREKVLIQIIEGSIAHKNGPSLLENIHFSLMNHSRIAVLGKNGSGKSTFLKALIEDPIVLRKGVWSLLQRHDVGYLDQYYQTLSWGRTVFETIKDVQPSWSHKEVRSHLNDFLFRKEAEVGSPVQLLSGGERVRLSLAQIAATTPKLLILDEITNNLDLETKEYVTQVLSAYPGAIIVVSHEEDFLECIKIQERYKIQELTIKKL